MYNLRGRACSENIYFLLFRMYLEALPPTLTFILFIFVPKYLHSDQISVWNFLSILVSSMIFHSVFF